MHSTWRDWQDSQLNSILNYHLTHQFYSQPEPTLPVYRRGDGREQDCQQLGSPSQPCKSDEYFKKNGIKSQLSLSVGLIFFYKIKQKR